MLGKTISHYEITDALGAGAMGEVFAARDTLLGRKVAIKILRTRGGFVSEESRLRFLQEARAASALNHPGIVTIYDVVRDGDVDCIVMELVRGETLDKRIARGPLPLEEALDVADRIADALAAAHASGIVHRDLKPANVMLTTSAGLKVLDFGLAKLMGNPETDSSGTKPMVRTQSGAAVGTPCYMSPEQVFGHPVDGRSDIFTLGSITAEMLTGRKLFDADSAVATMHRIAYEELPSLDDIPEPAVDLVQRMLAKEKSGRYQSAAEVREAIAGIRAGRRAEPLQAITVPRVVRASKRHALFAVVAALLIAIGVGGASQFLRTGADASPPAPARARETFAVPRTAHDHVRRGTELMATHWRKGYIDKAIEEFQRAIAIDANHAAAHAELAMAYWRKHDREKDRAWLDLSLKTALHAVELGPQLAAAHVALGMARMTSGDLEAARRELEQTIASDPSNAAAHRWLGETAIRLKDERTAESELRKAVALRPRDPELLNALGSFLYKAGRYEQAAAELRKAGSFAPDRAHVWRNLGASLHQMGDYPGAARALQQSLEIDPTSSAYSNLGTLYFFQGLYPQSVSAFEKAVQLGANHHVVWANLGDAYRWTPGNQTKAREAFTTALNLLADELRAQPDDAALLTSKAVYLSKQGDARGSLGVATALIEQNEKDPQNLYQLAIAFELSGDRSRSIAALQGAIRNGYSTEEVKRDPELASLRRDVQYQRMMVAVR